MRWLKQRLHFLAAVGAPFVFSFGTGHFRSALRSRAMDKAGQPVPWYTYPAVSYLAQLDFSDADILEFGGGQSTIWWSERARTVTCLEANETWSGELSQRLKHCTGVTVRHVASPEESARLVEKRSFDVIIVDDGSGVGPEGRQRNAETAFGSIRAGGLIVVDNADAEYSEPILRSASNGGWNRIDFMGFTPGSLGQSCTSVFFKRTPLRFQYGASPRFSLR